MNPAIRKFIPLAGLLAVAFMTPATGLQAAENSDKGAKRASDLAKYDRNHNGKIDPDEAAAMRADAEKQKTPKKAKGDKK